MEIQREFVFTSRDFNYIRKLVQDNTGIVLSDGKYNMVYSRLSKRLRSLSLQKFTSYCDLLRSDDQSEIVHFINAITTNLTSFFREQHHFDFMVNTLVPEWIRAKSDTRRIRIWSAGCSTGEEPYSIAMTLREHFPQLQDWDVKILATDLDTNVLVRAKAGIYDIDRVDGLSRHMLKRWFLKRKDGDASQIKIHPELQRMITFKQLNLLHDWPFKGGFDLVFCRNVMIYFNKETQRLLTDAYASNLDDNGYLFIGHAESLFKVSDRFSLSGNTIYKKIR